MLSMPLSPYHRSHPAGISSRLSQFSATSAAFALRLQARLPGILTFGATDAFTFVTVRQLARIPNGLLCQWASDIWFPSYLPFKLRGSGFSPRQDYPLLNMPALTGRTTGRDSLPSSGSYHPIAIKRTCLTIWLLPSLVDQKIKLDDPTPSLHPHYGASPLLRVGPSLCPASVLSPSWVLHLGFSLDIGTTGSHVPQRSLVQSHATFTPEAT